MNSDDIQNLLHHDKNFIYSKRFNFDIEKLLERYPDGAPAKLIAQVLLISEEEVEKIIESTILQIRSKMKVEVE